MNQKITLRAANPSEIAWINAQYDQVGFKHSNFDNEFIVIAEVSGQKAGLGRLQRIDSSVAELGGIFVNEQFRGLGLASKIVEYLLSHSDQYSYIYCLPFAHLGNFYKQFGFKKVNRDDVIPTPIAEKHNWCNQSYGSDTLLFVIKK